MPERQTGSRLPNGRARAPARLSVGFPARVRHTQDFDLIVALAVNQNQVLDLANRNPDHKDVPQRPQVWSFGACRFRCQQDTPGMITRPRPPSS
jgi:hypothetical protein